MNHKLVHRIITVLERCIDLLGSTGFFTYYDVRINIRDDTFAINSNQHQIFLNPIGDLPFYKKYQDSLDTECLCLEGTELFFMDKNNNKEEHGLEFIDNIEDDYFALSTQLDTNVLNIVLALKYLLPKHPNITSYSLVGDFDDEYLTIIEEALNERERKSTKST